MNSSLGISAAHVAKPSSRPMNIFRFLISHLVFSGRS